MYFQCKLLHENAIKPSKATEGSAGFDLHAALDRPVIAKPGEVVKINTGVAIYIQRPDVYGLVAGRSGLSVKNGMVLQNCVGIIDSDYQGEILVFLRNTSQRTHEINCGDRVAQIVFHLHAGINNALMQVDEFSSASERGDCGFGSTGK